MCNTAVFGCAPLCFTANAPGLVTTCKVVTGMNKALDIVNSVVNMFQNRPDVTGSPYCKMAEDIDPDELTGGGDYVKSAPQKEEAVAPTTT